MYLLLVMQVLEQNITNLSQAVGASYQCKNVCRSRNRIVFYALPGAHKNDEVSSYKNRGVASCT
jgi:hypothetical protein